MLDQCWASVVDVGPTLVQHSVDVSCLLGSSCQCRSVVWKKHCRMWFFFSMTSPSPCTNDCFNIFIQNKVYGQHSRLCKEMFMPIKKSVKKTHATVLLQILCDPANTKHLYNIRTTSAQRLRRWSNIVPMLYNCFVFTRIECHSNEWHVSRSGWYVISPRRRCYIAREIGMCLCGDNHCHVYT